MVYEIEKGLNLYTASRYKSLNGTPSPELFCGNGPPDPAAQGYRLVDPQLLWQCDDEIHDQ